MEDIALVIILLILFAAPFGSDLISILLRSQVMMNTALVIIGLILLAAPILPYLVQPRLNPIGLFLSPIAPIGIAIWRVRWSDRPLQLSEVFYAGVIASGVGALVLSPFFSWTPLGFLVLGPLGTALGTLQSAGAVFIACRWPCLVSQWRTGGSGRSES